MGFKAIEANEEKEDFDSYREEREETRESQIREGTDTFLLFFIIWPMYLMISYFFPPYFSIIQIHPPIYVGMCYNFKTNKEEVENLHNKRGFMANSLMGLGKLCGGILDIDGKRQKHI